MTDMMIHFECPRCGKKFKSHVSNIGKPTRCSRCGTTITVPLHLPDKVHVSAGAEDVSEVNWPADSSAYTPASVPCPTCAYENPPEEEQCQRCGVRLPHPVREQTAVGSSLSVGQVLSRAWRTYLHRFPLLILGTLLVQLGGLLMLAGVIFTLVVFQFLLDHLPVVQDLEWLIGTLFVGAGLTIVLILQMFSACYQRFILRIARGDQPSLSMLLEGIPLIGRHLWAALIYLLGICLGLILLIVPGVWFALAYWPITWVVIDDDDYSFRKAWRRAQHLARGTSQTLLGLLFTVVLLTMLTIFTGGLGLVFSLPYGALALGTLYVMLTEREAAA
ncbi:MAG: hypothetical protein KatS3mg114_1441 [Planctomycetaceae bacterium]|nr:MAG: hypothetical protein KatS3mg114_1441 [Planctomycetaceae bacterium]